MTIYWNLRQRGQTIAVSRFFARNDRETFIFLTKYRIKYWSEHFVFRLLLIWVFLTDGFGNFGGFFFLRFLNITFMAISFYFNCLYKIVGKSCNIVIIWILLSEWLKNSTTKKSHTHTHTQKKFWKNILMWCTVSVVWFLVFGELQNSSVLLKYSEEMDA